MALFLQFISVVIPIETIEKKCKHLGGFKGILELNKKWVGKKILYDQYLYKDGAMGSYDIGIIVDFWEKQGLIPTETKNGKAYWKDLCVVDFVDGATMPCEWLEYDRVTFTAWMREKPKGDIVKSTQYDAHKEDSYPRR